MADKQPIDAGLLGRLTGAWSALTGKDRGGDPANAFFGAGQAPLPNVPEEQQDSVRGRQFDFPVAINQRMTPRQGEQTTFGQLRALADNCDVLRLVIETRKDQLSKMKFAIRPINPKQKVDQRCHDVEAFFKLPDGENNWDNWLRMLLEDMFVLDAATVYPWLNNDGSPYRFELLDGSTIKRVLDDRGRTPAPPSPAYQQVLKGIIAADYTVEELVYAPRNRRTHKVYGYSPVEQILMTVNVAIRRALYQLQFYTEGSTPDLLFQVPADWNMTQIKDFNDWWQSLLSGNTANRRKAQFVPNGVTPINTKEGVLTDKYDEWLARIICYAFSVSHQAFVAQVNRATAESAQQQALEEGLYPIMQWVKGVCDTLMWRYFGYRDLEFVWEDQDSVAPDTQSQIDDRAVKNGTMTINEIRAKRGDDPVEGGDVAMVLTVAGYVPITQYFEEQERKAEQAKLDAAALAAQPAADDTDPTDPATPPKGGKKGEKPADGDSTKDTPKDKNPDPATDGAEKLHQDTGSTTAAGVYKRLTVRKAAVKPIDRARPAVVKEADALSKALRGVFAQMTDSVIKQLDGLRKADGADELSFEEWVEQLEGSIEKHLISVVKSGAKEAYQQLAIDNPDAFTLANDDAVEWAKTQAADMVGMTYLDGELVPNPNAEMNILESTREMIRADVSQALDEGWTTGELADRLKESYAFSDTRAEMIARTETARADVQGSLILYKESGVVEAKQWITGAECCDDCQALDGVEVPMDANFPGEGGDGPPLHPQCRCDVIPVVQQSQDTEGETE